MWNEMSTNSYECELLRAHCSPVCFKPNRKPMLASYLCAANFKQKYKKQQQQ